MSKAINNHGLFDRMNVPYPDVSDANAAIAAFYEDVQAAREKHRIANVLIITEVRVGTEPDDDYPAQSSLFRGDARNILPMVARAYGQERERHEQMIEQLLVEGRKSARCK